MGSVTSGIPRDIVSELARLSGATTFVETGTFQGATTRWATGVFEQVHTIELSLDLYDQYHAELEKLPGVHAHQGDSAVVLPQVVSQLDERPTLFWLDGHWSGGETAGESSECPVMQELECIQQRKQDLILIDDARLFLCAPPRPHKPEHWPTIAEITARFDLNEHYVQIINDVIFIVPKTASLNKSLVAYAQSMGDRAIPPPSSVKRLAKRWLGT